MSRSEWAVANTADLSEAGLLEIGDGYRAKNSEFAPNGGLPFVRVGDVSDRVRTEGLDELPIDQQQRYEPKVSREGDCLITMKGTVGRVAYVGPTTRPFVYSPQISYWRVNDGSRLDRGYLRYWLRGPEFNTQAFATKSATDMADYINLRDQRRMRITLPPVRDQRRIAAVLAAFDDLIEINDRRIGLVEDLARSLYREWFVHFRFPGNEDVDLVDSELGPIPEGWEVARLGDTCKLDKGLSYKGEFLTDQGKPMANLKCLKRSGGFRRLGTKPYSGPFKERHAVQAGDLIVANTDLTQAGNVIGSPAIVPMRGFEEGGLVSHHLFVARVTDHAIVPFVFQLLADERFRAFARARASGTTVLGLRADDASQFVFAMPPGPLIARYQRVAADCLGLSERLVNMNEDLAQTRDLLLPRLVTGKLDISDIDLGILEPVEPE